MIDYNRASLLSSNSKFSTVSDFYFETAGKHKLKSNKKIISNNLNIDSSSNLKLDLNFKASLIILLASILFSIVNLLGKVIGFYYSEVENSSTNLIRGLVMILICHIYFYKENIDVVKDLNKPKEKLLALFVRCFTSALCNYILFESFKYMRISTSITIFNINPIIVSILSVIILKSEFTKTDIASFLVCFMSVCMLTKPSFIFGMGLDEVDTNFGIFLSLSGAFFAGITIFMIKILSKDFQLFVTIYGIGICFCIQSLIALPFATNGLAMTIVPFIYGVILSIVYFFSQTFFAYAVTIGNPIKILPITYVATVLNFAYSSLIFNQPCDNWDLIGSFFIIAVNIFKTIKQ
jgi:drug/metabolite transporter (DMT)-like permease